jgi:hypothetical protein
MVLGRLHELYYDCAAVGCRHHLIGLNVILFIVFDQQHTQNELRSRK